MLITTAHSARSFCAGSYPALGVSKVCDDEDPEKWALTPFASQPFCMKEKSSSIHNCVLHTYSFPKIFKLLVLLFVISILNLGFLFLFLFFFVIVCCSQKVCLKYLFWFYLENIQSFFMTSSWCPDFCMKWNFFICNTPGLSVIHQD